MNKKIFTGSLLLGASLLFSACTLPSKTMKTTVDSDTTITTETSTTTTPTPTLSKDNSVDSIETELKSTVILDEDFSDI